MANFETRNRATDTGHEDAVRNAEGKSYRQACRLARLSLYSFQEIRRHLMIKRPHFIADTEEGAGEGKEPHKSHHHTSKNHVNRHHKKHDHTTTVNPTIATTRSTWRMTEVTEDRTMSTEATEKPKTGVTFAGNTDGETVSTTDSTTESTTTTLSMTSRPKKVPRRQKVKETSTNRTEVEDEKPQRRRKVHHHRRNNTFTNSVHDEVPTVNVSETETTVATQVTTTSQKHHSHHSRYTTVPTTPMKETTVQRETSSTGTTNDFTKETTITDAQTVVSTGSESSSFAKSTEFQKTTPTFTKLTEGRSRTMTLPTTASTTPMTTPVTVSSTRKFPRVQKNRTTANLGPSRIDVTILESPDRKNRQG